MARPPVPAKDGQRRPVRGSVKAPPKLRWTLTRQRDFLSRLAQTPNVSRAARAVGMSSDSAYALRRRDPGFAKAWADALEQGYSELEHLLLQQSLTGTERVENLYDADGTLKSVKTIRSFPLGDASRLLRAHRDTVIAHRNRMTEDGAAGPDGDIASRVREEMARVRARHGLNAAAGETPA